MIKGNKITYSKFIRIFVLAVVVAAVIFSSLGVGNAAEINNPYGVVVSDLEEIDGLKHAELSEGVKNVIKRARQIYEIKWTALSEIESYPGNGNNLFFREGVEYQGLPYGQPVHKGVYVGFGCSLNDYIEATQDLNSNMYATRGENTWYFEEYGDPIKYGPYFATDCSGFVSYCWGLSGRNTTGVISEVTYKKGDKEYKDAKFQYVGRNINELKVGYALNKAYSHIILVYDIVYDKWGDIVQVSTLEQTPPFMRMRVWGAGGNAGTLQDLQAKIDGSGYDIICYTGIDDVKFEQSDAVPINKEQYKNNVSNPISATVSDGVVNGEAIITEDTYALEGWTYNTKNIKKVEYSVDGGDWKKADTEKCGDILKYKAPSQLNVRGRHTVKVKGTTSDGEYQIAEFVVRKADADYSFLACFDEMTGLVMDSSKTTVAKGELDLDAPDEARISMNGWGVCTESVRSFEYRINDGLWTTLETDFRLDVYKSVKAYKPYCDAFNSFGGVIGLSHLEGGETYTITVRGVTKTNDVFEFASIKVNLAPETVEIFGFEMSKDLFYTIIIGAVLLVLVIIAIIVILIIKSKKKKAQKKTDATAVADVPRKQLVLNWHKKTEDLFEIVLPEGFCFRSFDGSEKDIDAWLDIVQYGLTNGKQTVEVFKSAMEGHPDYLPEHVYFVEVNGVACATISVFCNDETKHGYVHMVAAKPEVRGKGVGTALAKFAVNKLIEGGMQEAHLTTDDFRIPAIKTYLKAGFEPCLEGSEDFASRWEAIYAKINA